MSNEFVVELQAVEYDYYFSFSAQLNVFRSVYVPVDTHKRCHTYTTMYEIET